MCTNVIIFLQEEKETVGICTNVIVFLQGEKETVDICTNVTVFRRKRLYAFVLMLLFFFRRDCRHL